MELSDRTPEELFELMQEEENWEDVGLVEKIFDNLALYTRDQKSVLENVWGDKMLKVSRVIDSLVDNKLEKKLELEKLEMKIRVQRSIVKELRNQAKKLERAKFMTTR